MGGAERYTQRRIRPDHERDFDSGDEKYWIRTKGKKRLRAEGQAWEAEIDQNNHYKA